jgi:large subunit ribosomal protein L1
MAKRTLDAVKKALDSATPRSFEESVELAINLKDVDMSNPKNRIEEDILLPHGRGKDVHVAVFASGELALKAKKVADLVIPPEDIEDLAADKRKARKMAMEMDFLIAEAPLMPVIGRTLGVVLGPRGKMPRPILPGADPAPLVESLRKTIRVRSRDRRTFHAPVGTRGMTPETIAENVDAVIRRIERRLERGRLNISSAYVKTTMGPAVRLI